MNFNKAIILGRVTKDPETRKLPSGQSVATFGIATNRVWYDANRAKKEEVQFHNIVMFGKLADTASQYLQKGALVLIEGRIQYRSWDDKNGQKHFRTEIVAENLQLGPRAAGGSATSSPKKEKPASEADVPTVNEDDIDIEEEIPF